MSNALSIIKFSFDVGVISHKGFLWYREDMKESLWI